MNQFQSLAEVISALKRRALLIFIVTALGCLLALNYALNQPKVYEATAVVQIEDAQVPDQLAGANVQSASARRVRLIEQRLMARDNLVRIMAKHDLFADDPDITMNERIFRMRVAVEIQEILNRQSFGAPDNVPSGLMITVRLSDPVKAADLANELMFSVIEQSRDRSAGRAQDTLDFFVTEETRIGTEIEALEAEIATFKRANATQLPEGIDDLRTQMASLRETDLDLDQQILSVQSTSSRQRDEVVQRQVLLLSEQKLLMAERMAVIAEQIDGAPEVARALGGLERSLDQLQEQYTVVTRRKAEAELGQILEDRQQTDRFEVLETALIPEAPVSRSRKKLALMGGVASVFVALAVAFVVEVMNPAIRSAAQMERALGFQPVVAIPMVDTRQDRRRRGLTIFGWAFGLLASAAAAILIFANSLGLSELIERYLPSLAARS